MRNKYIARTAFAQARRKIERPCRAVLLSVVLQGGHILVTAQNAAPKLKLSPGKPYLMDLASRQGYIGFLEDEQIFVNLAGYYGYLEDSYYLSQELKNDGKDIHPTCQEILDGFVVPIFLEKCRLNNLSVPKYYITNGYFEPPVIVDSVNPFMSRQSVVLKNGHQERVAKSLTRNFTYAICCQELTPGSKIATFRSILGWTATPKYRPLAAIIWNLFCIPLATVRVIISDDHRLLLSGLQPLPFSRLTPPELRYIENRIQWPI